MAIVNSSAYSYGTNTFGSDSFGVDVLPAVCAATSSTSADVARIRLGSASVSASASVASIGGFTANGSASILVAADASSGSIRVREGEAQAVGTPSVLAGAVATYVSGAISSATSVTASVGEKFVLEESSAFAYGTSTYGTNVYDYADFQTIVAATSVGATVDGYATRQADAGILATSAFTVGGNVVRVREVSASLSSTATLAAHAVYSINVAPKIYANSAVGIDYIRIRKTASAIAADASVTTIGREKWESLAPANETWTPIPVVSETWTKIAA